MTSGLTRRRFVQGSVAIGGSLVVTGPLGALAARAANGEPLPRAAGYGPLFPTPEIDSGIEYLALPRGFQYRLISKQGDPSTAFVSDTETQTVPTPGIFDGMGAFPSRRGTTILVRNHENRERAGELPVVVPQDLRYDPDPKFRGGNTIIVVDADRRATSSLHVLGGTSTNCAGGVTPWGSWITCEEVFSTGSTGVRHGYNFEVPAYTDRPVKAEPIVAAGRFAHEAGAWLDGVLYQTEDQRGNGGFYRYTPDATPRRPGDLAAMGGVLEMLAVRGRPQFDMDDANPGESFDVDWVRIEDPDPSTNTVGSEGAGKGAAAFNRPEGCWIGDHSVYFSCTEGGGSGLGQLWRYTPDDDGGQITLVYESVSADQLEGPDNVVFVPRTGDVLLQEDANEPQFVRGVTPSGQIYDFCQGLASPSEFCGGCFSPNGKTFFLNHQGDRGAADPADPAVEEAGLTFAIWGPFDRRRDDDD